MQPKTNATSTSAIVFFDGVCGLCNHTVDFLLKRDRRGVLKFAPLQGETAAEILPEDVRKDLNTFVFADDGHLHYRSSAMARILMRLGGVWWPAGAMLWLVPSPIRNVAYRVVARLRYRLFGRKESCRMPTPEERSRFLN